MQELASRSGLSKTKIHHYLREGLLPQPQKSARNASLYGDEHVDRLSLIAELRDSSTGELSIPEIRSVLSYTEAGMSRESAVRLVEQGIEPVAGTSAAEWQTVEALANAAGTPAELVQALEDTHLISREDNPSYSAGDLLVARACDSLCGRFGVEPADLTPLFDLIREVGDYSESLTALYASHSEAESTDAAASPQALRASISAFLDAVLWRALET